MTREEAEKYAKEMTYRDAINNLMKARSIPYRKATFIKVNELLKTLEQEPKTGHWIWKDFDDDTGIAKSYWCSECNMPLTGLAMNYCGCCGTRMVEPQERSE